MFTLQNILNCVEKGQPREHIVNELFLDSCINGNIDCIESCIIEGANLNYTRNYKKRNGLLEAICNSPNNISDVIDCLIKHKTDINAVEHTGSTALILAAFNEDSVSVKSLLKHVPNINIKDEDGLTALDYAEGSNNKEIIKLLS